MLKDAALRRAAAWLVAALLYDLWPWDIVPDFVPLVGWVDDALVTGIAAYMAYRALKERFDQVRNTRAAFAQGSEETDPYKILGVGRGASADVIKAAYRARLAEYHPDKTARLGEELRALAEKKTKAIIAAYEKLGSP